jgi:hypothetical protein
VRQTLALIAVAILGCALSTAADAGKRRPLQHVTIFGDSVAAALDWDPTAAKVLARGNRLTLDLAPCRRLTKPGCISPPPPSVLKDIRKLGRRIGPTVVVLVGYNDDPHVYAAGISEVLRAMHRRGVKHVIWLTLRAVYQQYTLINQVISGASARFPWMTVLNWNGYSRPHRSWFASDGIHFSAEGAVQFAIYLHRALERMHLAGPAHRQPARTLWKSPVAGALR